MKTSPTINSPAAPIAAPAFLPLLAREIAGYSITPVDRPAHLIALYTENKIGIAEFAVKTPKGKACTVEFAFRTDAAPIPLSWGINGMDGGELAWQSHWRPAGPGKREYVTELTDFDGDYCLPRSACAVLRALGFTVSDDCLASPL